MVKLVAAVLILVTAGLGVIGVVSAVEMRSYLLNRTDGELIETAQAYSRYPTQAIIEVVVLPVDYFVATSDSAGNFTMRVRPGHFSDVADLPQVSVDMGSLDRINGQPFTIRSPNGHQRWRVLITQIPRNREVLIVAENLANVDSSVDRLVFTELLVGTTVLVILAAAGIWMVRVSLRPLVQIEHTAAAIADGDLTQRVPDADENTEVGRLALALNAMLAQIEGAFRAQAASEASAQDAAAAAQASESRARRSEERMRQFVADASHELRTPLTSIRGFAELYRQGAVRDQADTEALLRRIEDEASRMGLLVVDLLLLARLDQERPLDMAHVPLRVLATDAVAAARAVAPDRDVTLEIAPDAGPLVVSGDDARLRQVVGNLMTNALTHTPAGTPVTIRLRSEDDHSGSARGGPGGAGMVAGTAVLEVVDHGLGLTPDQAERIFERFYRVDPARTRRAASAAPIASPHSGSGLGLAIVAALVAAHNGSVEVESVPGRGATFRVRLPLAHTGNSQAESTLGEAAAANLEA
jgi:two-component system OmpR family sensor kinase